MATQILTHMLQKYTVNFEMFPKKFHSMKKRKKTLDVSYSHTQNINFKSF